MATKLLPCPFCGSKAELFISVQMSALNIVAKCTNQKCAVKQHADYSDGVFTADMLESRISEMADKWNRRWK